MIAHAVAAVLLGLFALVAIAFGVDTLPCRWRGHPMTERRIIWRGRLSRLWRTSCYCGKRRTITREGLRRK